MARSNTNNGAKPMEGAKPKESPTNIRNGKELIDAALDAFENDRCRTALIQPQRQAFYMDCRRRSFYDFRIYLTILGMGMGDAGRWLARSTVNGNGRFSYQADSPPSPQKFPRLHLGPAVARMLKELLLAETEAIPSGDYHRVMQLLVFEGASGRAIQKYCVVHSAGEAAAIAFHHLVNGYSLVFAGIILRQSYDDVRGFREVETWESCKTIQELEAVADRQPGFGPHPLRRESDGKETIGIIY